MARDHIEFEGTIVDCGAGGLFRVETADEHIILATLSGKMRKNRIRVVLGDTVTVAVSPSDATRGFITYRER